MIAVGVVVATLVGQAVDARLPTPVVAGQQVQSHDRTVDRPPSVDQHEEVSSDGLFLHFLDVGQADATLIVHPEAAILIDAGHWRRTDLVDDLRRHGVDRLDLIIITHPHADHLGQFDQVMAAMDVAEVWWSGSVTTTATFARAVEALESSDAHYHEPRAGEHAVIGPVRIDVVNPPAGTDLADLHDAGLAVVVTYGNFSAVFTGDAEAPTEQRMAAGPLRQQLRAQVLQLGHHGSSTSTTPEFLAAVAPAVAIWSAAIDNDYGHPHQEVIARLEAAGIAVFGTADHGHLSVWTDGDRWTLRNASAELLGSHE